MNYVVQTSPGFSRSILSGWDSSGSSGGLFRRKKLVIFLWVFVMAVVAAVVLSFTIGTLCSSQSSRAAGLHLTLKEGWVRQ